MSHSRKQQQQTFNTHSRFTAGRASHDTSALCRELNAAGSADTEQTCCCLFFFLFLCFVWVFFFWSNIVLHSHVQTPVTVAFFACLRLPSPWQTPIHASNLSASQYFSVTLALQRALGLRPFAPTSPPPCDFVMLSKSVLTDITGVKLFILKADTALRMQLQSNIRTQTWHEAQESIQRGQL